MNEDMLLGILIGMAFLGAVLAVTHRTYRQTLQHIADCEGTEKLPDGKFYYLVPEDVYNGMQRRIFADTIENRTDKGQS